LVHIFLPFHAILILKKHILGKGISCFYPQKLDKEEKNSNYLAKELTPIPQKLTTNRLQQEPTKHNLEGGW
jgi:hypothetical protein